LVQALSDGHVDGRLVDVQWQTPHLARLGVVEIPRRDYLARLEKALSLPLPEIFAG
jgi:leucyl/phenylalanyl-tRNA--protein transferase